MADILIRDLPDEVLAAIDNNATRLGLSRNEYLRRQLALGTNASQNAPTPADWHDFAERFADLADPRIMDSAWQ